MKKVLNAVKECWPGLAIFVPLYAACLCLKLEWYVACAVVFGLWCLFWTLVFLALLVVHFLYFSRWGRVTALALRLLKTYFAGITTHLRNRHGKEE